MLALHQRPDGNSVRFGVAAQDYDASDASFDLRLTFLKGETYCCAEFGCHFGFFDGPWFDELAQRLHGAGWRGPQPTRLRSVEVQIEQGVVLTIPPKEVSTSWSYRLGPFERERESG